MVRIKLLKYIIFPALFGLILFNAAPSYADCTSPASPVGGIAYDSAGDFQAVLACDGTDWVPWAGWTVTGYPAPQYSSAGGGGSSVWFTSGSDIYYSSGSVGIGTADPSDDLEIVSEGSAEISLRTYSDSFGNMIYGRRARGTVASPGAVESGNDLLNILGYGYDGSAWTASGSASIAIQANETWTGAAQGSRITFDTTANGTTGRAERMRIDHDGRVGIGTTAPSHELEIESEGDAEFSLTTFNDGSASSIYGRRARGTKASPAPPQSGNTLLALFGRGYDGSAFTTGSKAAINLSADETWSASANGTRIEFETTENGTTTRVERMRIDHNGNVGIGDTNPSVALDVVGDINYTGQLVDVSDIRLKENVRPLQSPLAKLTNLNGFAFEMKDDPKHVTEYGVSAQDVQKVFPELVSVVDSENGTLGVNYNGLIAPMIEAIKAQQVQIESLQAEIEALKDERRKTPNTQQDGEL